MKKNNNMVFAYTQNQGEMNQARGAATELTGIYKTKLNLDEIFIENSLSTTLKHENFHTQEDLETAITDSINTYFKDVKEKGKDIPEIFIVPYNQADKFPQENIDTWSKLVKKYYKDNGFGNVTTITLTAKLHDYKDVDFIHIPDHALTKEDEKKLEELEITNKELFSKIHVTEGILHNMTPEVIKEKGQSPKLKTFIKDNNLDNDNPKILYCLGGKTADGNIIFDMHTAANIMEEARLMALENIQVLITNGPRTPSDVTDYIYDKCLEYKIPFVNAKPLAEKEEDFDNWIKYQGPNMKKFEEDKEMGNIYPGILSLPNIGVIHTSDTYASCETASSGIPTGIHKITVNPEKRPDCIKLPYLMQSKNYAVKSEDFIFETPNKIKENLTIMPSPLNVISNKIKDLNERKKAKAVFEETREHFEDIADISSHPGRF